MSWSTTTIGFALTGSHCQLEAVLDPMRKLVEETHRVIPIFSRSVAETDTRFGDAARWRREVVDITGQKVRDAITEVEPIGPEKLLDVLLVAPCTGNTLAKIANAITDGPVTMAAKSQLRNGRPVVLAVSTNDGLRLNAKNLGSLLAVRRVFFVPFGQDDPQGKPTSLIADFEQIPKTARAAWHNEQIQPLLVTPGREK